MPYITPNHIHSIRDFDTHLDFLRESLGWPIPEDVELEDIAYPWSPEDLDLNLETIFWKFINGSMKTKQPVAC